MRVFIDPLFGREEPIGIAFISYSRKDRDAVHNIIESGFKYHGIPYFLDEKDIVGGTRPVTEIETAIERASCGIIVLSDESLKSPWVWYETGVLVGRGKHIFPFVVNVRDVGGFLKELPEFIRQLQVVTNIDKLVSAVRASVIQFENLYDDEKLNLRVVPKLRKVKITVFSFFPDDMRRFVRFGYQLVRFGKEDILPNITNVETREEAQIIGKVIPPKYYVEGTKKDEIRLEFIVPVHKKLGVKFKPFLDVLDIDKIYDVISILQDAGAKDVKVSHSGEKQRIYFLFPMEERNIFKSVDGILDHYIFPL